MAAAQWSPDGAPGPHQCAVRLLIRSGDSTDCEVKNAREREDPDIPGLVRCRSHSRFRTSGDCGNGEGSVRRRAAGGRASKPASPALIEKVRTAVTDGTGQYRIEDLRPGTYTVTLHPAGLQHR